MIKKFTSILLAMGMAGCQMSNHPLAEGTNSALPNDPSIHWEVVNRFRIIDGEDEERRFIQDVSTHIKRVGQQVFSLLTSSLAQIHENYRTHWDARSGRYVESWLRDTIRQIRISVNGLNNESSCIWQLGTRELPSRRCNDVLAEIDLRTQPENVTVEIVSGARRQKLSGVIEIADIWIVGLGDSYASGEGNPHIQPYDQSLRLASGRRVKGIPAVWWDSRCHRSLVSGQALAAAQVALQNQSASVTFLSFACSGAAIPQVMLTGWKGRESIAQLRKLYAIYAFIERDIPRDQYPGGPDVLHPQLEQMRIALTDAFGAVRSPDYVLISVGGNDIGFGQIAADLLLVHELRSTEERCPKLRTALECYQDQGVSEGFEKLASEYYRLYEQIHNDRGRAKRIILTEYPNLVMAKNHAYCSDNRWTNFLNGILPFARRPMVPIGAAAFARGYGLDLFEAKFADVNIIRKLNEIGKKSIEAAEDQFPNIQWLYAAGIYQRSSDQGRGYCSKPSWFLNVAESLFKQGFSTSDKEIKRSVGTTGILHPNVLGHCQYADDILAKMGIQQTGTSACDPSAWTEKRLRYFD
jgi:hypothetical protein